jgi:hypothetical protein
MLEYSTYIDDSIPCQLSRIFHSKSVEYANILLIPCRLTSALVDLTSRSVARATLTVNFLLCLELETPQTCDDQIVFERYSLVSILQ